MKKFSSTTRVSSRRTSQTKKRIGLLLIVGLLSVFLWWLIPQALATISSLVMVPIQSSKTWLFESSGNLPQYFRDRSALVDENEQLREDLALQGGNDYVTELLQKDNEELRALLGAEDEKRVLAGIIGRPDSLPYDVLVIDRGSNNGLTKNAPVYIGDNRVIGLVSKVFRTSAVVTLLTTPGHMSSVYIIGPDIYTNAVGLGGGQLRVGVPQGIDLEIGNSVILPSVHSQVFGSIEHIESLPTRPEQYGFVSTDIPLQSLRHVAVGSAPLEDVSFEDAQEIVAETLSSLFTVPVPEGVLVVPEVATSTATTTETIATTSSEIEL